jgi:hypothetical protein
MPEPVNTAVAPFATPLVVSVSATLARKSLYLIQPSKE